MNLIRAASVSWEVLLGHRLRTFLSSSGIAIGVAAVVLMVGAGKAAEADVVGKVRTLGTNLLTIQAGRFRTFGGRPRQVSTFTTLTENDVRFIERRIPEVARVAGMVQRSAVLRYRGNRTRTSVAGVDPEVFAIRRMDARSGRLFTSLEARALRRVAVLGPTVVQNLFPDEDPLGKVVEINQIPFTVVGVATPRGQDLSGNDQDDVVYVPLRTAMKRLFHVDYLQTVLVEAQSPEAMAVLPDLLTGLLRRSHRLPPDKEDDFTIQDQTQLMASERETSQAFTALVGSVAGVSLFTGGVGILAVMLISIRERTREIGLRRALGATKRNILVQFVLEAGGLAVLGGTVGALLGVGGTLLTCRLMGWPRVWPWSATLLALGLSFAMGVLFGLYPARRAARLEPASALHAT